MWVTTDEKDPSYLRLAVLTRFNGDTWTPGDRDIPETQVARGRDARARRRRARHAPHRVEVPRPRQRRLRVDVAAHDAAGRATMSVIGDWRYDTSTMDFMSADDDVTTAGMTYDFTGRRRRPRPGADGQRRVGRRRRCARPTSRCRRASPATIRSLAAAVTGDEPTRFRKARALQQWFREDGGFEYGTDAARRRRPRAASTPSSTESGRVGYCEQFAASMAIMARILGIPARVAVGFLKPQAAGPNLVRVLRARPARLARAVLPGCRLGAVRTHARGPTSAPRRCPPTPAASSPPSQSTSPSPSATRTSSEVLPYARRDPGGRRRGRRRRVTSFPWVAVVLVALGLLLVAPLVLLPGFVRRQRRERRLLGGIEDLWLELRDHGRRPGPRLAARSIPARHRRLARPSGSARPRARRSARTAPRRSRDLDADGAAALDRLVEQIERARYSRSSTPGRLPRAGHARRAHDRGRPRPRRRAPGRAVGRAGGRRSLRPAPYVPAGEVVTRRPRTSASSPTTRADAAGRRGTPTARCTSTQVRGTPGKASPGRTAAQVRASAG